MKKQFHWYLQGSENMPHRNFYMNIHNGFINVRQKLETGVHQHRVDLIKSWPYSYKGMGTQQDQKQSNDTCLT